ncbi:hypothetical protein [Krasilnikovia sp. MM14-A1259]|uniref:hypothetical protein n=1 Tax=Krasilnikovia sp. MM14-A1259 TaxID=3373539 RepID=UPI00381B81F2
MIHNKSFVAVLCLVAAVATGCASPNEPAPAGAAGAEPAATRPGPDALCRTALDSYYNQKLTDDPVVSQQLAKEAAIQAATELSALDDKKLDNLVKALNDYGLIAGKIGEVTQRGDADQAIKLQSQSADAGRVITREANAAHAPNCAQLGNL